MIRKSIFLIFLFLFLAISAASAADDNSTWESGDEPLAMENPEEADLNSPSSSEVNSSGDGSLQGNVLKADSSSDKESLKSSPIKFSAKDVVSTYGKKAKFSVKVSDEKGNLLKNRSVTFKVAGKTYNVYTDSKGIASVSLKLNAGKYKISYSCDNFSAKSTLTFKNYFKITVYKWKSGADVRKNRKIKSNIPNSALVKRMVNAAKKGTPVIKFKGGNGKKVFITAGVHGNEISSQLAALKLIKYLETHPIKGTVYIMPFMNPKGTAKNVRDYNGIHLNKKADVKGTISYKTVKLIKKFKCDSYGDFHCTRPGGKPGKNIAMGTYNPTAESAVIAKYIAKKSNVKYLIYKKAGSEYPGALEDVVNLNHIPAVTCEVISPHGRIAGGSVSKSMSMMKSLLKFNGLL